MNIKPANQHELPWVVRDIVHRGHISTIQDTHGNPGFIKVLNDPDKQTANFVKVACNSHHDLVGALESCLAAVRSLQGEDVMASPVTAERFARLALAKAKG